MMKNQLANCTESRANILIIRIMCSMLIEIPLCKARGSSAGEYNNGITCWRPATLVSSPRNGPHEPVGPYSPPSLPHLGRRDPGNAALLLRGVDRDPPSAGENAGSIHADGRSSFGNGNASGHPHGSTQLNPNSYLDADRHFHRVYPTLTNSYRFAFAHAHGDSYSDIHADGDAYADRDITPFSHGCPYRHRRAIMF